MAEDGLHEKYPELADLIETEKNAKIDYMMMQARHFSTDRAGSLVTDAFRETYQAPGVRSPRLKGKTKESPGLLPVTPILNKKKSAGDFMFEMDDDPTDVPPLSLRRESSSQNHSRRPSAGLTSSPLPELDQWYDSRGKKLPSPSQSLSPSLQKTPIGSPAVTATSPRMRPVDGSSPWGHSPMASKLGIRDIMAQASSSRASNLSMALSAEGPDRPRPDLPTSASFQTKQSQKERKKSQQYQAKSAPDAASLPTLASSALSGRPGNPWQTVAKPKTSAKAASKTASRSASPAPAVVRNVTAPPMTMRQTLAGSASSGKQRVTESSEAPPLDAADIWPSPGGNAATSYFPRSPAGPATHKSLATTPQRPMAAPGAPSPAQTVTSSIQSIRHIPKASQEPVIGLSLADILSEQQAEKTAIHDAVTAKRSLQEIQQEQEFQEWWDLESRRVMEEEQRRSSLPGKSSRGGSSRGKSRRGRGPAQTEGRQVPGGERDGTVRETAAANSEQPPRQGTRPVDKGAYRGRGRGRGRGGGPAISSLQQ